MKRWISLVLTLLLVGGTFAACGNNDEPVPSDVAPSELQEDSSEVESPIEEPAVEAAYMTGLEKGSDYPEGKRVTGVMVNNIMGSRPTRGLSEAQIVYEMRVEGGITRFMAVFEDYEKMPMVGSVRSARDQFFQMLVPSWGFYVHDGPGQNQPVIQMIRDQEYADLDMDSGNYGSQLTWRDSGRSGMPIEYTEYTDGEHIANVVKENDLDDKRPYNSTMFAFTPWNEEPRQLEDGDAKEVAVVHSQSYRNLFTYDEASGRYMMEQFGKDGMSPAIDENNGEQIGFDNMLILFTVMYNYTNSELVFVGYDSGVGYYFNGGRYEVVRWKKGGPQDHLQIFNNDTTETTKVLNPGTSYIAMVDDTLLEAFVDSVDEGTAAQTASEGTINPNETETED